MVDGFQISSQVVVVVLVVLVVILVVHQELVILDEDNHQHQVFEMILLIMELVEQVNLIFDLNKNSNY